MVTDATDQHGLLKTSLERDVLHREITDLAIKAYYQVYNTLGPGFLERVYERSLEILRAKEGLQIRSQVAIEVIFEQQIVGSYCADLILNECVIIEVKAVDRLNQSHGAQLLNYLKATKLEVGLLMNFGNDEPEFRRKILTNDRKPALARIRDNPSHP